MSIILATALAAMSAPAPTATVPAAIGQTPTATVPAAVEQAHPGAKPLSPKVAFDGLPWSPDNVFAKIIRGEVPAAKVYEDAHVLAFMDNHPRTPGHVLVISKTAHARNILEIDERDLDRVMAVVKRIAAAELRAFHPAGIIVQQNNGWAQSVPHLHVHIIPVYLDVPTQEPETTQVALPELERVAAKLRAAMR